MPDMPDMRMSHTATSTRLFCASSMASAPLLAASTSYSPLKMTRSDSRGQSSSSQINSVLRRGWKPVDLKPGQKVSFKGYGGRKVLTRAAADVLTLAYGRSFTGASGAPDAVNNR